MSTGSAYFSDDQVTLYHGDCIEILATLDEASIDAICTDPPYGLEFMGKDWDAPWKAAGAVIKDPATERGGFQDGNGGNPYSRSRIEYGRCGAASLGFQQWCTQWATECLRVLKPGGHLLAFGGSRTWHRLAAGIEDAGFEIRDSIAWLYGSGFPKSLDVSKAIDKAAGAKREVIATEQNWGASNAAEGKQAYGDYAGSWDITDPATDAAKQWNGWGTALKPAFEPIIVARKPIPGSISANVLVHGTGALNIDACRVDGEVPTTTRGANREMAFGMKRQEAVEGHPAGRWPANVLLDDTAAAELDKQSGASVSRIGKPRGAAPGDGWGMTATGAEYADGGGASRFFPIFKYTAKAGRSERPSADGTAHPTVKPRELMGWLIRLVTPPGGVVLDPFAGSGTTIEAAIREGKRVVGIEREATYLSLIQDRLSRTQHGFDFDAAPVLAPTQLAAEPDDFWGEP